MCTLLLTPSDIPLELCMQCLDALESVFAVYSYRGACLFGIVIAFYSNALL